MPGEQSDPADIHTTMSKRDDEKRGRRRGKPKPRPPRTLGTLGDLPAFDSLKGLRKTLPDRPPTTDKG